MAVEIAQQSHWNVLAFRAGSMLSSEVVAYRPFPRAQTAELLAIDGHVVCQKVPRRSSARSDASHSGTFGCRGAALRDEIIFEKAERAYKDVGLIQHSATLLGAEVDGEEGFVAAPRHRVGVLMMATAVITRKGACTPALLSTVLGLWVHIVMFRRPALALLDFAFKDARLAPRDKVRALSRETLNELLSLTLLASTSG